MLSGQDREGSYTQHAFMLKLPDTESLAGDEWEWSDWYTEKHGGQKMQRMHVNLLQTTDLMLQITSSIAFRFGKNDTLCCVLIDFELFTCSASVLTAESCYQKPKQNTGLVLKLIPGKQRSLEYEGYIEIQLWPMREQDFGSSPSNVGLENTSLKVHVVITAPWWSAALYDLRQCPSLSS